MPQVVFQPSGVAVEVEPGTTLLEAVERGGVQIRSECAGQGACGKCRVEVKRGEVTRLSMRHELPEGQVLACRTLVGDSSVEVFIPQESRQVDQEVSVRKEGPAPAELPAGAAVVSRVRLHIKRPSLEDNCADSERLLRALSGWRQGEYSIPLGVLRNLPRHLRDSGWEPEVTLAARPGGAEVLDVTAEPGPALSILAVDIGTTVLKVALLAPEGRWRAACANSQAAYGPDVISRIIYCEQNTDGAEKLHQLVVEDVNRMLSALQENTGLDRDRVWAVVASGNTTMIHLFLGMCPFWIRREPYVGCSYMLPPAEASEVGVDINPAGKVFCLPSVSSYVGADIAAGVLATRLHKAEAPTMLIDLGTNGEIVVGNRDFMLCCSASAGPAFEGGGNVSGTWAKAGAIASVWYDDELHWQTLGREKPIGICGSGYIDLLATLLRQGVMDKTGVFVEASSPALRQGRHGALEYVLVGAADSRSGRDIVLTQADVQNLVRAKGAIYAAGSVLLDSLSMEWQDLDSIMLAGGFGESIDIRNAMTIGLLPDVPRDRIRFVGNTSLQGAVLAALHSENYAELRKIASGMTYFELSTDPGYMNEFVSACFLPHTDTEKFSSVTTPAQN